MIQATAKFTPGADVVLTLCSDEASNLLSLLEDYMLADGSWDVTGPAIISALRNLGVEADF